MNEFLNYLNSSKETYMDNKYENVHLVLGNESCDMDSTFSPLALAYLLSKTNGGLVLPVINTTEEYFATRTDSNFLLKKFNVSTKLLTFRDQINFDELLKIKRVTTSLVDHHILAEINADLKNTVVQVFDHRPIDPEMDWDASKVTVLIQEVGSCATLITNKFLTTNLSLMFYELAYLLYSTILYDTVALSPEANRAKELDFKIVKDLEEHYKFGKDRHTIFKEVRDAHMDVSSLTPKQLILKDLKIVNGIPIPGLPMLVEDFLKDNVNYRTIVEYAENFPWKTVVIIGLDTRDTVKRDVGIYWKDNCKLKELLVHKFKGAEALKGYNFNFKEVAISYENMICFRQGNIKLSRKQILPLVKDASIEINIAK